MNALVKSLLSMVLAAVTSANAYEPEIGELPGPIEQLEYVDGAPLDVSALRGKPLVLYFGADWCVPCVERGRPATVKVANKYGPMGLQVVFVSMDDNKFRQQKIEESKTLGMRIAMPRMAVCPPGKCPAGLKDVGAFGRIYLFPTAIVLDANGIVRAKMDRGMGIEGGLDSAAAKVLQSAGLLVTR